VLYRTGLGWLTHWSLLVGTSVLVTVPRPADVVLFDGAFTLALWIAVAAVEATCGTMLLGRGRRPPAPATAAAWSRPRGGGC
jgi:hypothetical protein